MQVTTSRVKRPFPREDAAPTFEGMKARSPGQRLPRTVSMSALVLSTALCATPAASQSVSSAQARTLFQAGIAHAQAGTWSEALKAFQRAYDLAAEPAVLFNLAGAQLRVGRMLAAASNYTRFRHLDHASIGPIHRAAADQQLAWIEAHVPRLRVAVNGLTERDKLTIDRQRISPKDAELEHWLDPGAHEVSLVRPDGHAQTHRIVLAESEHRLLALTLP
jgi:hypothetical protein